MVMVNKDLKSSLDRNTMLSCPDVRIYKYNITFYIQHEIL